MEESTLLESDEFDGNRNPKSVKEEDTQGCYVKARHALALIQFFGMFNMMTMRNGLTVAIVAMVTTAPSSVDFNSTRSCPERGENSSVPASSNGVFHWNMAEQGLVLGCYFYGYVASILPGACLSKQFGMKYTVGIMTVFASVLTVCIPFVAYYSFVLLVAVRVLIGSLQGVVTPAIIGSWGIWGPISERSSLISLTMAGTSVGTFLNLVVSGIIAKKIGWPAVFYITGGGGLVWSLVWLCLVHDSPDDHPRISQQEKDYIQRTTRRMSSINKNSKETFPRWKSLATSTPLWAICVALFTSDWGFYILISMLPTYMATVLNFDIAASGFLSALPFVIRAICTPLGGYITCLAQNRTDLSIGTLRRINQTLSLLTTGLFLVLVGYVGCDATAAVAFFCVAAGANSLTASGALLNIMDIAPRHGAIMVAICNTAGNLAGFLTPQVAGFILLGNNSIGQWQIVFWVSAGVQAFGTAFYLIFASGEEQKWAKITSEDQELRSALLK